MKTFVQLAVFTTFLLSSTVIAQDESDTEANTEPSVQTTEATTKPATTDFPFPPSVVPECLIFPGICIRDAGEKFCSKNKQKRFRLMTLCDRLMHNCLFPYDRYVEVGESHCEGLAYEKRITFPILESVLKKYDE